MFQMVLCEALSAFVFFHWRDNLKVIIMVCTKCRKPITDNHYSI